MEKKSVQYKSKFTSNLKYPLKKITLIYNKVNNLDFGNPQDILADEDTVKTAKSIAQTLIAEGTNVELFEVKEDNFTDLLELDTDFFFNLCYGIGSIPKTESEIPKILDLTGIPYTGANAAGIVLTTDKVATKKIFQKVNIPTPDYQLFQKPLLTLSKNLKFPLIVKPQMEDCSLGINNDAVVEGEKDLRRKIEKIYSQYKEPVLVEQFINTRELNVTIIGNGNGIEVLPISEIIFGSSFDKNNKWKIVDFAAKWLEDTDNYKETVGICPAILDKDIESKIKEFSITAYKSCRCRDYARFDIRLDEDSIPYFLEINLNPGIGPEDGTIRSAKAAGYTYGSFIRKLIDISLKRYFKN